MNTEIVESLWHSAGVKSFSELSDFPFPCHADFVSAVQDGSAQIGIDYQAARELAAVTRSPLGEYILLAISWIPFLLLPASIAVAVATGSLLALLGVPLALIGFIIASPYAPLHGVAFLASLLMVGYCVIAGSVLTPSSWLAFTFAISFLTVRIINQIAWKWAHQAVLQSGALTAYLWNGRKLHVKGKSFGTISKALQAGRITPTSNERPPGGTPF